MAHLTLGPFGGANKAVHPKMLPEGAGTVSLNHKVGRGDLRPWREPLTVDSTIGFGRKSIYLMGRDKPTDQKYFFAWSTVVHAVRSFLADDTTKRTYFTGSGAPKVTDNIMGLSGYPYPTSYRDLGIPKPATTPTVTQATAGDPDSDEETRFYAYAYLSNWDEVGMPAVSAGITVKPGATVNISSLSGPPSGAGHNRGINRIRIWRTVVGAASSEFYFLMDIPAQAGSALDDGREPGTDVMQSAKYAMPPDDLHGLIALWNGMMAGITGKSVRYCEAYRPHAWPAEYETLLSDDTPVALGVYQNNLVITTTGKPRIVYGASPESMNDQPIEFIAACVSAQSAVSMGHGVAWAAPDGLAYVGGNGTPRLLTDGVMLPEDWAALNPSSIVGCQVNGLYVGFYLAGGSWKGFMVDPLKPSGIYFLSVGYQAAYFDPLEEVMYVMDGGNVMRWDAGAAFMTATFKSKVFRLPKPVNFCVAEVIADGYPATFKVWADGVLRFTKIVQNSEPFYLTSGYLAENYQFEISTSGAVQGAGIAESVDELRQI